MTGAGTANGLAPAPALVLPIMGTSACGTSALTRGDAKEVGDGDGEESGDVRPFSDIPPDDIRPTECAAPLRPLQLFLRSGDVDLGLSPFLPKTAGRQKGANLR